MARNLSRELIGFAHLGEYRLHVHAMKGEGALGASEPFHCAIRNREELKLERIELHRGEELHGEGGPYEEIPLLRLDENGLWAFIPKQEIWYPLRQHDVRLGLDSKGIARLVWD